MTHNEIEELLGAYALDALDADERQEVEDHLATCPRCRAEIAAHREVTALLGNPAGDVPAVAPDDLWDRISASLQDEPPALSPVVRPTSWRRFALIAPLVAVAAALILVVGLLAAKVGSLDNKVKGLSTTYSVGAVILNPSHRTVQLTSATGSWHTEVVVLPDGQGFVINPTMPSLPSSQTFQLWALSGGRAVSLGVLGSRPSGAAIRVEPTMTALMITAEPLGGTPAPTTPVLVRANLPEGLVQ
jgi:anti-sigma-K factor RskA